MICALGVVLGSMSVGASGTNYFVSTTGNDANRGTARTNAWRTIQWAVNHVGPGDSIVVLAGTYAGALIQRAGLPNAPITLKADDGAAVLLNTKNPVGNSTHNSILWAEDWDGYGPVSYWIIQGFEIANSPLAGIDIRGVASQANSYITILSNRVHNSASRGIFTSFVDDVLIAGNESYSNGEHGVYCSNSGDRPVVRGNRLYRNVACGVHMNGDVTMGGDGIISGGLVENNLIYKNGTGGSGINMDGVEGTRVQNNLIYSSPNGSGIALFQQNGAVPSRGNTIMNNTVIMNTNVTGSCGWALTLANAGCVSNRILNNIFYSFHSFRGAIQLAAPAIPGLVCNYNAMESCFSTDNGNTAFTSLVSWRALGYDSNSIIATPSQLFVNLATDDYHMKSNSPAIDKGTLPPDLLADIEGAPRLQGGAVDMGAYEAASPSNWTIVVTAPTNGTISPSGFVVVPRGGGTNFLIKGAQHYHITGVETNRTRVGSYTYDNSCTNVVFTWNAIATNGFLAAGFAENQWSSVPETWLARYYSATGGSGGLAVSGTIASGDYGSLAVTDTDGDGKVAWQEYLAGTDPVNSESVLRIMEVVAQGVSNRVAWLGGKGGSPLPFCVFRGTNLAASMNWSNVAVVAKDGTGTNVWWDVGSSIPSQVYYRITVTN